MKACFDIDTYWYVQSIDSYTMGYQCNDMRYRYFEIKEISFHFEPNFNCTFVFDYIDTMLAKV